VKRWHERLLGRPVTVELVESVLRGGEHCRFRITVG
jgi:predicted hydrocarbon binding protein